MRAGTSTEFTQISQFLDIRDKDRKRGEKKSEVHPAREFEQIGQFLEVASKSRRKPQKHEGNNRSTKLASVKSKLADETVVRSNGPRSMQSLPLPNISTREHRSGNRAAKVAADSNYPEEESAWSGFFTSTEEASYQADSSTLATAAEALRKAERKRRKEQKRLAKTEGKV